MKSLKVFCIVICIFFQTKFLQAQSNIIVGATIVEVDTVYTGLDIPWEIIYGPDGFIWTTERKGIVSRIDPVAKTKTVILDITSTVRQVGESGLLGMALHPQFGDTPEVFLVYTYGTISNFKERVVKYTYNGTTLVNEVILIDNITANSNHNGSRMCFLQDNTLLISTGDAANSSLAQNLNSKNGKMLRINQDGTIPSNNPFPLNPVYAFGHRNVQGILKAPNGKIYLSEHGPTTNDEFQVLESGRNYGWPEVEGFCDLADEQTFCAANNVKEPIIVWTPTVAPSDMVFYSNPFFPEFDQRVLMTTLKDKRIIAMKLNSEGTAVVEEDHYLTDLYGRLRDIAIGPNKEIYLATNGQFGSNTKPNTHSILVLKVLGDTGFNDTEIEEIFKLSTNLDSGYIEVEITSQYLGSDIQISDMNGKIIFKSKLLENNTKVDFKSYGKGIYTVSLQTSAGIIRSENIVLN